MYHFACYSKLHHTIHCITTSTSHCTTIMAELNPYNILTLDLLLAIGNRNNRVHAVILQQNSYADISIARKCVLIGGLFFSKPTASFGRSTFVVLTIWV
ncbi:hypothetical protein BDZ91DRAFT_720033, partial [Kalaharituber pfeilii]